MTAEEKQKVPFEPGFAEIAQSFPGDALDYLESIKTCKQNHQRKFAFTNLENQIVPLLKSSAAFYAGCVLWASYLYWRYKNDPREIEGNYMLTLSEEEKEQLAKNEMIDYISEFAEKLEKSAKYYLNRSSKFPADYVKYFDAYRKFAELNNHFKELKYTNEIKLPEEAAHFESFDEAKLEELKKHIDDVIIFGNLETLLETGFYK